MNVRKLWSVCALLACSCASTPAPASARGQTPREIVLAIGTTERVSEWNLTVTFDGVVSDSRCPRGVTCVWRGDAAVRVVIDGGGAASATYTLHTDEAQADEIEHGRMRVRLLALEPEPTAAGPVRAEDYRATLRLEPTP